jgi:hypothetical protein
MIIPKEIKQKPIEYIVLLLIFIIGFSLYIYINNSQFKIWIISGVVLFYFIWSLYHHYKRGDLHTSIIIEYLLFILLGVVLLLYNPFAIF